VAVSTAAGASATVSTSTTSLVFLAAVLRGARFFLGFSSTVSATGSSAFGLAFARVRFGFSAAFSAFAASFAAAFSAFSASFFSLSASISALVRRLRRAGLAGSSVGVSGSGTA